METSEETVNREPRRLDEVLDRDELRTLVHDREAREAADRLVNLLQLARGELLTTPQPDRVAADDVVAGDHPRQRLGPAPFVRVDRRFGGDRILLERTDAHAETAVVLDREADERTGPNAVRRRPVFREGYAEARVSKLLDLTGFQLHTYRNTSVDVDMCSGCIRPRGGRLPQAGHASGPVNGLFQKPLIFMGK